MEQFCGRLLGELALEEDPVGAGWEGVRGLPGERGRFSGEALQAGGVVGGGEDGEPAGWGEELDGGRDGFGHIVYGAEGDGVEFPGQGFGAGCVYLGVAQVQSAEGFAEEGGFFVLGFGEGDGYLRMEDGDGEPGEAGAGAEIEKTGNVFSKKAGGEDGLEEVAAQDAFFVADGGEVSAGVPFLEQGEVGREFCGLVFGELGRTRGG